MTTDDDKKYHPLVPYKCNIHEQAHLPWRYPGSSGKVHSGEIGRHGGELNRIIH